MALDSVVVFRGGLAPRVPAEAGVPSRFCGPARSGIRYSTEPHFHSNWTAVDAGWKPALRGVWAVRLDSVVVFRGALAPRCRLKPAFQAVTPSCRLVGVVWINGYFSRRYKVFSIIFMTL